MRKALLLLALLPAVLQAQNVDSAEVIIGRYVTMLNYESLPTDSLLVMKTTISYLNSTDTFVMRRWYAAPNMTRVEVWRGDSLTLGFCTNGTSRYREYSPLNEWWSDLDADEFARRMRDYDFRGPLHDWHNSETHFTYTGTTTFNGQPLLAVKAEKQDRYICHYLFEKQSGLLLFIIDTDEMPAGSQNRSYSHIQWKAYHEYLPIGPSLLSSEESYLRDELITVMRTTAHFEERNDLIFNQDRR